jgi:CubicO group peptidase (beta-lactamase class C family)
MRSVGFIGQHLVMLTLLAGLASPATRAQTYQDVEQVVHRRIEVILPPHNVGGAAVAIRLDAQTHFFNYGAADVAKNSPATADSIFNLASVGKLFAATLLAQRSSRASSSLRISLPITSPNWRKAPTYDG